MYTVVVPVSYTHLDVYKRQDYMNLETAAAISSIADYSKMDDILGQAICLLKLSLIHI